MKPAIAIALKKKPMGGEDNKYLEKQKEDDYELAKEDAFEEFAKFMKAGENKRAMDALASFIELCESHEY